MQQYRKNIMEAQKLLLDIKKRYVGNYEGMIGKISNFSWDLNSRWSISNNIKSNYIWGFNRWFLCKY